MTTITDLTATLTDALGLPLCRWIGRRVVKDMAGRKRETEVAR